VIAAVVLAAGAATRYGMPKQRLLVPAVLGRLALCAEVGHVVVVQGAHALDDVVDAGVELVRCDDWELGPGASLRRGLAALPDAAEGALVVLGDGPDLDPQAVERVLAARAETTAVAASYDGTRGHPLYLPRSLWHRVPDRGLQGEPVELVPCGDLEAPGDVDVPSG
jgi:CTP:molybdopterin cytidylyltransferase MocA